MTKKLTGTTVAQSTDALVALAPGKIGVLELVQVRIDGGTQTRVAINGEVVSDYAEAMAAGTPLPPVIVYHDGKYYWLADGFHRLAAAREAGRTEIEAEIRAGGRLDALRYALGANTAHGLRRSNADKRLCVQLALQHFGDQSDRALAELCGVGHHLVAEVRKELGETPSSRRRVGRDGKARRSPRARSSLATTTKPAVPAVPEQPAPEPDVGADQRKADAAQMEVVISDGSAVGIASGVIDAGVLKDHLQALEAQATPVTTAQREWLVVQQRLTAELVSVINGGLGEEPSFEALRVASDALRWVLATMTKILEARQKAAATAEPATP